MTIRTFHRAFLTLAALTAAALPLQAEDDDTRFPMNGAGVPDNRQAAEKFDRATTLFKAARWDEGSAKLYEMVELYGDRLVLFGAVGQYVSARRLAAKMARELPPEGLAAWRRQVDPRVGAALASASRPRDFRRILRDFPNATREPEVRLLLARALADEGDVEGEAEALWGLIEYPGDGAGRAGAAARLAIDLGALNDREGLDALEAKLGAAMSDPVRWRGKNAPLKDVFKAARALLRGTGDDAPAWAAWPTFGGNGSRDRIAAGVKGVPPVTARYNFTEGPGWSTQSRFGGSGGWTSRHPESLLVQPAIADGLIVVNEGHLVWAKELSSDGGRPLWTIKGLQQPSQIMYEERCLHGSTIAGGRAFFTLATTAGKEQVKMSWLVAVYPVPLRKLFCVEAQSGRRVWETGGDATGKDFATRASYHGAPVVDGDRLYCAATYGAAQVDPSEHWVVCLDANTGKEIWRTFVASGIPEINLFGNTTRESVPHALTVSGDRILACTNLGIVACLDRTDGGLLWERRYPRFKVQPIMDAYDIPRNPVTWLQSPIYHVKDPSDGKQKVVVAPMDSPFLFCLSAEDGEMHWQWPKPANLRENDPDCRYIIGVREGVIYLSGESVVAIELKGYKRVWPDRLELDSPPSGRGLVASDGVYIPLRTGLLRLGFRDPSVGKQFWRWPTAGMAGHVMFVDQAVVTAGNSMLTVCYDPAKAKAFLEAEILKNPGSAYLRYRLAICLQAMGDTERAEATLKQALDLAEKRGDEASMAVAESCRRTLFRSRLTAAAAMLRKSDGARRAAEEYEKARPYASTEGEWLELLFASAQARRAAGDLAGAVAVLQEVIAKHGDQTRDGGDVARLDARRSIDAILASGREPYAAAEQEAAGLLARARKDNDPALFEDLLKRFPNSLAAEDASYGAGHARFAASDWPGACDALQKFLKEHPQSGQAAQAMAELAVAFEKRAMWGMAGAQLRRMKKSSGEAQIRIDGGAVSASKWAEARLAGPAYKRVEGEAAVPEVSFPAEKAWSWAGQRGWDLKVLDPEGAGGWKSAPILAVSGATLVALDPAKGTERWRVACPNGARWAAWSAGLVVVAGPDAAEAFHEDGSSAWRTQYGGAHLYEGHETEGAVFLALRNASLTASFVVALDAATGQTSWRSDMQPGHIVQRLWVTDEGVAWLSRAEDAVIVADRESGALRARWPLGASRVVQAGPDRFLALTWENELTLLEASTGRALWRAPQPGMRLESALTIAGDTALTTMTSESGQRLRLYDLDSGKLRHEIELGSVWIKQLLADASTVYVAYKKADGTNDYIAAAYELSSGKELWRTPVPGVQSMFPGTLAKGHVLLNCPVTRRPPGGGAVDWVPTIVAIDKKTGVESGRIEGRPEATPTYSLSIAPGRVVIAEGDTVEAWGR
ncbi:MAG: PQQ-binding-like beta-propeller repeat protein [Planctomycetota bacterium]